MGGWGASRLLPLNKAKGRGGAVVAILVGGGGKGLQNCRGGAGASRLVPLYKAVGGGVGDPSWG